MKISFDIDCTPEEARAFLGLPDLAPLHAAYLDRMKGLISDGLTPADWEKLARAWAPGISGGIEQWQKLFMAGMGAGMGAGSAQGKSPKG
jgi:hypothetical protein